MKREATTTALVFLWALMFSQLVKAVTMNEFVGNYDGNLVIFAAGFSFLGGFIRTILNLQSDNRIVRDKVVEAGWDAGKALVAGMVAFFLIQAIRSSGYAVPSEVRFGAIVAAGWSRMAMIDWLASLIKQWVESKVNKENDKP